MALSAATTCPCVAAAGCLGSPESDTIEQHDGTNGDKGDDRNRNTRVRRHKAESDDDDEVNGHENGEEEIDENSPEHDGRPITGHELVVHDERRNGHPLWLDREGRVYGRASNRVLVSDDWYKTTDVLYSFPREHGTTDDFVQMVIVPESGRIIVGRGGRNDKTTGRVEVIDPEHENARTVYEFDYGRTSNSFGHAVYGDIIVVATYERSNFEAGQHANEVILSTDGGASFKGILEAELYTTNATNLHIHDVEYDPFAELIWVVVGDGGNCQIYWSDDLGSTWETIGKGGEAPMLTQVVAFEDRVVFGTDGQPDGILNWERDGPTDEPDGVGDLEQHITIEEDRDEDGMRMYARRRWHVREEDGRDLCLIPFGYSPMHPNWRESVVLGTVDGYHWYELYRVDDEDVLITMIMGPQSKDGDRRTLVSNSNYSGGYQIEATVPAFWE